MSEQGDARMEAFASRWQGARGERGPQGKPGEKWPAGFRRSLAALFLIMFGLIALAYWGLYHQQQATAQQRCGSIAQIVHIPVPVPTAGNPSRTAWARYEQIERDRGVQLGCVMPPPRYAPSKP